MKPATNFFTPFRTVLLFVTLSLAGWAVVPLLPVDLNPTPRRPTLQVTFQAYGLSPLVLEQEVTAPLENALSALSGIQTISSSSGHGEGWVLLAFHPGADLDYKRLEAATVVRHVFPQLPDGVGYPLLTVGGDPAEKKASPLLIYTLYAGLPAAEVKAKAEAVLLRGLTALGGLQEVSITGAEPAQIAVDYRPDQLTALGLSPADVQDAIRRYNRSARPGAIANGAGEWLFTELPNPLDGAEALRALPLRPRADSVSGRIVRLGEVARIALETREPRSLYRVNGQNAVRLVITAQKGVNQLQTAQAVKNRIGQLAAQLPNGFALSLDYDDTQYLSEELAKLYRRTGLSAALLLGFILLFYRSARYLTVLLGSVLVNLSLVLLAIWALELSIHLYTLAGLSVSFGLLLDNAIVMVDHLHKRGSSKVFLALLAASLTTVAALLLVFFLPEEDRLNLAEFVQVVALAIAISLAVAAWFTPALYRLVHSHDWPSAHQPHPRPFPVHGEGSNTSSLQEDAGGALFPSPFTGGQGGGILSPSTHGGARGGMRNYERFIAFLSKYKTIFLTANVLLFGLPVFMLPAKVEGWGWYNRTVGSDWYQEEARPYVDRALGGTLRLFALYVYENSGYRTPERTQLYINAELPAGHTLAQMDDLMRQVEAYLGQAQGLQQFVTRIYSGQQAQIIVTFAPEWEDTALPHQLKSRIIGQSVDWGGAAWNIYGVGKGFSNRGMEQLPNFRVEMRGFQFAELERQAQRLADSLLVHKRIQEVNINERVEFYQQQTPFLQLTLREDFLWQMGIRTDGLMATWRAQAPVAGAVGQIPIQGRWMPVVLRSAQHSGFSRNQLLQQPTSAALPFRLADLSDLTLTKLPNTVRKEDRRYLRVVSFNYYGSAHFGQKHLDEQLAHLAAALPAGYSAKQLSYQWNQEQAKRQYGLLAVLLVVMYVICAILFESLRLPLLVLTVVPISFVGLFLTFSQFDFYFDQGGYAAFVLLGGLTVNASIFVLFEHLQMRQADPTATVAQAALRKGVAIVLTVLSTVLGMAPFLSAGQAEVFWFAFAAGTSGGLIFSLYGVFVVLPVLGRGKARTEKPVF